MTREEIKNILPHREPMLLVDEAEVREDGKAYGSYTVRGDEYFLQGHFPGNPIVPGVIQCEMAAQTCCVLLGEKLKGKTPLFSGINKVKFKTPVRPGDKIDFECQLLREVTPFFFAECKASVGGKVCFTGELSFAVI
ncbi:MAG: 3-hydroxyacyl-ACP dehydratase FabZ [Eubacteriales bacterium]|nr:3-hydroxyacyl-ACP dehydratase FabZ [Eubacteriales bacterium]MDD4476145.1 3-hydroxyacyl-ACP dehydratase FabZ [Eubacteriales bacterium]